MVERETESDFPAKWMNGRQEAPLRVRQRRDGGLDVDRNMQIGNEPARIQNLFNRRLHVTENDRSLMTVHFAVHRNHLSEPAACDHPHVAEADDQLAATKLFDECEQFMAELIEIHVFGQQGRADPHDDRIAALFEMQIFRCELAQRHVSGSP
jgi:hypothetical protein